MTTSKPTPRKRNARKGKAAARKGKAAPAAPAPDSPEAIEAARVAAVAAAVEATPVTRPPASRSVDGGPAPLPTYAVDYARRREPKPGTYRATVIAMCLVGATMKEVRKVTGWNERQAREGVRLTHYKCGYGITEDPVTRVITLDAGTVEGAAAYAAARAAAPPPAVS